MIVDEAEGEGAVKEGVCQTVCARRWLQHEKLFKKKKINKKSVNVST